MRGVGGTLCAAVLALVAVAGCIDDGEDEATLDPEATGVLADLLPVDDDWYRGDYDGSYLQYNAESLASSATGEGDVRFHVYDEVLKRIAWWNETWPHLISVQHIGDSHQGRPLKVITVTDESVPADGKRVALFDGGHHGNEYAGSEVMLYLVDLLLTNEDHPVVTDWLRSLEIQVLPTVNPDGYDAGTRHNANGVNLNRNYDIDWGNPTGTSNPFMGEAAEAAGASLSGVALVAENCGASAFSEPESQAVRDWMAEIGERAAFYLSGHTATHAVIGPWAAADPPNELPAEHRATLDGSLGWIRESTEYEAGRAQWGDFSAGLPYAASGSSMDWFYVAHDRPAFIVEVEYMATSATAEDYPFRLLEGYEGLDYWMQATIPIHLHLLANAEALATWQSPDAPVPELAGELPDLDWDLLPDDGPHFH